MVMDGGFKIIPLNSAHWGEQLQIFAKLAERVLEILFAFAWHIVTHQPLSEPVIA